MKVAIYANMREGGGAGGVQTMTAALIKALGELHGPEEYVLIGPPGHSGWLEEVRGRNQTIFEFRPDFGGVVSRFRPDFGRVVSRLLKHRRKTLSAANALLDSKNPYSRIGPHRGPGDVVPLSTGVIESLGAQVVHFPFQHFIVSSLPSVFNPHDLQHLHFPQFFKPEELLRRELSYPFACRLATKVVVASNWIAEDVRVRYALPASKIAVIPWSGQTARYSEPTSNDVQRVRKNHQLDDEYVFYPAVPWPHKNHTKLLEAFSLLRTKRPNLILALCGTGTEASGKLAASARQRNQANGVQFLGLVSGSDMRPLFKGARIVAVPTLFEAVSGPVSEAWLEGTPVACSDIPQLRDQADGAALFFDPNSSDSIAASLEKLLCDENLRERLANAGLEKLAVINWQETAERYRSVYRDAAISSQVPRRHEVG